MLAIFAIGTQYVEVPVTNTEGIDPTGDNVYFAFIGPYASTTQAAQYPPTSSTTWYQGTWAADVGSPYTARILVGPGLGGVLALTTGIYQVYVKIQSSPEVPVAWSGPLEVA